MKVEEKRKLKKIAIMEAALDAWSIDDYKSTSLTALAEQLKMTKQALYRYFKNKNDLLDSMSDYVNSLEQAWFQDISEKLRPMDQEKKLRYFVTSFSKALTEGCRYAHFDSFNTLRLDKMAQRHDPESLAMLRSALGIPERVLHLIMMYCFFIWGWHETQHIQRDRSDSEKIDMILELVENGLATDKFKLPDISSNSFPSSEYQKFRKKFHQEHLTQAVTQVIQEKGFQGVTLEQIADKAGISKSTLYNYFKNKDDMLTKTINILVKEYMQFHSQLLSTRESFEEKLLAHLELQCVLFPRKPQAFIIMKQFMSQDVLEKIDRPVYQPGFLGFLKEGIRENKLKPLLSEHEYQMVFSFFIFIERVIYKQEKNSPLTREILDWLNLLAYGYRGKSPMNEPRSNQ